MDIKVNVREAPGDCYVVDLSGEIDVYTSPKVKDAIGTLIDRGVREHGGSGNLVCTNPQIKKMVVITGLVKIFGIFESEDAAMKALV